VRLVLAGVGHPYREGDALSHSWVAGNKRARTKVEAILTKAGMTIDEVTAKTFLSKLDSFERLDRMLASLEARRNNALREIDRHRAALGGGRQSIEEIEDADFRDVETGQATTGTGP
jgi:ribosomal protein L12E/L44/L45/RPP1/RPP2